MIAAIPRTETFFRHDTPTFWDPGPETRRERLKLSVLHGLTLAASCVRTVHRRPSTSTFGILTYHRITNEVVEAGIPGPTINVTPERFHRQLSGLLQQGFRFVRLQDVLRARSDSSRWAIPERTVVLTFDDIYDNVYQNAFPVLQQLQIPATIFVSTAYVDSQDPFPFDRWAMQHRAALNLNNWLPIRKNHLLEMSRNPLIDVGAHTHTHEDFRNCPGRFRQDLMQGIAELESLTGCGIRSFAFPYGIPRLGFTSPQMMAAVQQTALNCGLTTGSHINALATTPFGWGRFHVFHHDTPRTLAAKLDGYYQWLPNLKTAICSRIADRSSNATTALLDK